MAVSGRLWSSSASWRRACAPALAIVSGCLLCAPSASARPPRKAPLTVESTPPGSLVSVHATAQPDADSSRVVAGATPLTKQFDFGKGQRLWLEVEHRGFTPQMVEVTPATGRVLVELEPALTAEEGQAPVPRVARVVVVEPEITVIRRGFSAEHPDEEESRAAERALGEALRSRLGPRFEVVAPGAAADPQALKSIWRDAQSAMELLDPIRLPYLTTAPRLETRSAREALRRLGEGAGVDAVLLVEGKQNEETGGMRAGKVGIMAAGTAASFASGYGQAVANGDSFFTYNVYLPSFAEGAALRAVLVHCATGQVLWINKGLWKPIRFDQPDHVGGVMTDLLAGLETLQPTEEKTP